MMQPPASSRLSVTPRFLLFLPIIALHWIVPVHASNDSSAPPRDGAENLQVVERVIDGDTIELSGGARIRYVGIDTPELRRRINGRWVRVEEPFSEEAYQFNRTLVEGKEIRLEFDRETRDRYNRTLAYVYIGGKMVNLQLIEAGLARVSIHPPNTRYADLFEEAEQTARALGRGIWSANDFSNKRNVPDDRTVRKTPV